VLGLGRYIPRIQRINEQVDINIVLAGNRSIRGVVAGESIPDVFIPRMVQFWRDGVFPVERLTETFDFDDGEFAIRRCESELTGVRVPNKCLEHILGSADSTRGRRAHLDEIPSHRVLVVHGVESHHSLHVRRSQVEKTRDLDHSFLAYPAALALNDPERRQQRRHFRWIPFEKVVELALHFTREDRHVRLVSRFVVRCVIRRLDAADQLGLGGGRQRSISPMTMSMLALMAMTSERRWPSTIFGIAARLTKEGGRIRQRTGLAVPSDTI